MENPALIILTLLLLVIVCCVFLLRFWAKRLGVLRGAVIYSDSEREPGFTLRSRKIPLQGRPDYLLNKNGKIYPVEFKKKTAPKNNRPYDNHIMQLIAYCYLVEEHFGKKVEFGFIKYEDREYKINYTNEYKNYLLKLVEEIYQHKQQGIELHCHHPNHY
jgi:CRISPR-associated exonuclease Cas4